MEYTVKAHWAHKAVLAFTLFEVLLLIAITMIWPPEGKQANLTVCLVLVLPLVAFIPFLVKRSIRAVAYLSFLSLFYFVLAVPNAMDPRYGLLAHLALANIVLLFIFSMLFTRWEQRRLGITITR